MGIKAHLSDFLNHLPAVDGPAERKALLTFTGPSEVGIYLDWQGSNVEFTERLLEQLSRRGKAALAGFLAGLPNAPQVATSVERQQQLVALRAQVDELDAASFQAEFPVPVAAGVAPPGRAADPAMLASTVVNDVLAPYYKLGADELQQEAGGGAVTLAERTAGRIEAALSGDRGESAVFDIFKQSPDLGQVHLLGVLKARLADDPSLARELAGLFASAAEEPERGGLGALVDVSRRIGVVKGEAVGAVVGADVLDRIQRVNVEEVIDTVEAGGTAIGVVLGGAGPMNIGGQHHHGDKINTAGGAFFAGDVQAGRDVIGGDQVTHGDQVGGDQITMGDVSGTGIAVGRGAQSNVTQGISDAQLMSLFGTIYQTIENRPADPDVDKEELAGTVQKIEEEVGQGDEANPKKLERWLKFLADMAPDIFEVTAATLANPISGLAVVIRSVAKKVQAET